MQIARQSADAESSSTSSGSCHARSPGSTRRGRNAPGEGGRLRGEIVAAAERLLETGAPDDGLSLRAVAREAGTPSPSVYLHFASKEELLHGIVGECFAALQEALLSAAAGIDEPRAALLAGCLAYCAFAEERPGAYRILFSTPHEGAHGSATDPDPGMDAFGVLVDGIAGCMAAGDAPPADPYRVAADVWAALHGISTLRQTMPGFPWPPLADRVRRVLRGLAGVPYGEIDESDLG